MANEEAVATQMESQAQPKGHASSDALAMSTPGGGLWGLLPLSRGGWAGPGTASEVDSTTEP